MLWSEWFTRFCNLEEYPYHLPNVKEPISCTQLTVYWFIEKCSIGFTLQEHFADSSIVCGEMSLCFIQFFWSKCVHE